MTTVYHSSPIQGLKEIRAQNEGTHGNHWVYAAHSLVMSALFLAKPHTSEFICAKRTINAKVTLIERFEGALDLSYANKQGAIYVLPKAAFVEGQTDFSEELVSNEVVKPLDEIQIDDMQQYLFDLVDDDLLDIYLYPQRPLGIPENDEDLIIDAVVWHRLYGDAAIEKLTQYHPQLKARAEKTILDKTYADVKSIGLISSLLVR